jgi:hypothetical protein
MYWIYDISTELLCVVVVSLFVFLSCFGLLCTRDFFYNRFNISADSNDVINGYISGMGMLYGLLLGLVAVATWENYDNVDSIVGKESTSISQLYRYVSTLQNPTKIELQDNLKEYLIYVIDVAWPAHKHGEVPSGGTIIMTQFLKTLSTYKANSVEEQVYLGEIFTAYNSLIENRRMRMLAVDSGIPEIFWVVIIIGGGLNIIATYLMYLPSLKTHLFITVLFSSLLGLILFLLIAVDHPLRGETSISSEAYSNLLHNLKDLDPKKFTDTSLR